ncbi:helix-turn-helix domain-containing protein [Mycolicibacterium elephantis]
MPSTAPVTDSEILNTAQVSAWLGVPPGTLRNWRSRNIGPACFKLLGGRVVYRRRAVEAWLATQEVSTKRGGVE